MKRNLLLFKFESLLLAAAATTFYLWHPTSLPIPINSLIPIMLNLLLSLILINERRTVLNNLIKLPLIGLFPYSLGLSICLFGASLISNIGISKWIILLIGLILFGVMLYPFLKVTLLSLQGIGWQIAGNITFMMTFYMASFSSQYLNFPTSISNPVLWLSFLGSFGIAGYAMKA